MSDVPYGVLLSGGLDSSIIAALRRAVRARARRGRRPDARPGGRGCTRFAIGLAGLARPRRGARWPPTRSAPCTTSFTYTVAGGARRAARRDLPHRDLRRHHHPRVDADVPDGAADQGDGRSRWCSRARAPTRSSAATSTSTRRPTRASSTRRRCASSTRCTSTTACAPTSRWRPGASRRACRSSTASSSTWRCASTPSAKMVAASGARSRSTSCARPSTALLPRRDPLAAEGAVLATASATAGSTGSRRTPRRRSATASCRRRTRFPVNPPQTKEAYFYRRIFEEYFPGAACGRCRAASRSPARRRRRSPGTPASPAADPSGRAVAGVHNDAIGAGVTAS